MTEIAHITEEDIRKRIVSEEYIRLGRTTTLCHVTLDNGFSVRGESACVDPAGFDDKVGRDLAFKDAVRKLWQFFGFALMEKVFLEGKK